MKRILTLILILAVAFAAQPIDKAYASMEYKDNVIDQAGDWAATLGKSGVEKEQVLAQRKAERLKKHAERMAAKKAKEAEKAGKEMKKKMGF